MRCSSGSANLRTIDVLFANLPETHRGQWGEGLTVDKMAGCRWLKPGLVVMIEYLEWTAANHLRHASFSAMVENTEILPWKIALDDQLRSREKIGRIMYKH